MSLSTFCSRKFCTFFVIVAFLGLAAQSPAHADMVGNEQLVSQAQTDGTRADLAELLTREDIQTKMLGLGDREAALLHAQTANSLGGDLSPAFQDTLDAVVANQIPTGS